MSAALLDHLWQSTLFALACAALTLAFAGNRAGVRFGLWFAASLKFLVPFAWLSALGGRLSALFPQVVLPQVAPRLILIRAEHLSDPARLLVHPQSVHVLPWLTGFWLAGLGLLLAVRLVRWLRLRAVVALARDLDLCAPVAVKASASLLEPGLVGIIRPVILFPAGLLGRLSDAEVKAILAHEAAHLKRRDNLTAAIHMMVEALFWFHPLVWLIGSRLIAERERACDESVLEHGHDAEVYAGSILGVCKFCIASPLACAAGAGGANLSLRVRRIMTGDASDDLGGGKQMLLAGAMLMTVALPVATGFVSSALVSAMQGKVAAARAQAEMVIQDGMSAMVEQIAPLPRAETHKHIKVVRVLPPQVMGPPMPVLPVPQAAPALVAEAAPAPIVTRIEVAPATQPTTLALDPRGEGDPNAVTCRVPQALPGTHLPGPTICKVNRLWAELYAARAVISPDGRGVELPSDSERRRSLNALACNVSRQMGGATNGTVGLPLTFCF